jgi:maltokinase
VTTAEEVVAAAAPLLLPYLERQTWYRAARGGRDAGPLTVTSCELLREASPDVGGPGLARLVLSAEILRLQVMVGWRESAAASSVLRGHEGAILGAWARPGAGETLLYDAVADEELLRSLLPVATGGLATARRARLVESLTSHASVVYDDRLFMKLYRVLEPPPRPEVEVMARLDEVGFNHIVAPVAVWRGDNADLALVREFHAGGVEGRALALTSLRDLLGGEPDEPEPSDGDPDAAAARAGGDLASEVRRLGETTARLHLALATAFGEHEPDLGALADAASAHDPALGARVRAVAEPGRMIRVHGDYHLRRVMRTDAGWLVVGFGDDPSRAARLGREGRGAIGTPLDDVADLCFSIEHVAAEAAARYEEGTAAAVLAAAWARRSKAALLDGYLAVPGVARLLPTAHDDVVLLLSALAGVRARRSA